MVLKKALKAPLMHWAPASLPLTWLPQKWGPNRSCSYADQTLHFFEGLENRSRFFLIARDVTGFCEIFSTQILRYFLQRKNFSTGENWKTQRRQRPETADFCPLSCQKCPESTMMSLFQLGQALGGDATSFRMHVDALLNRKLFLLKPQAATTTQEVHGQCRVDNEPVLKNLLSPTT